MEEDNEKIEEIVLSLLAAIKQLGYRRLNGQCWERRMTDRGVYTGSWRAVCTIERFVAERTCHPGVVKRLCDASEDDFPTLFPSKTLICFANGLFDVADDRFYEHGRDVVPDDRVACNYLECRWDPARQDWEDSPTPYFDVFAQHLSGIGVDQDRRRQYWDQVTKDLYSGFK